MDKLDIFIDDCKKILSLEEYLQDIKTTKLNDPLNELLEYGIKWNIISNASDLVKFCIKIPILEATITKMYDQKIKKEHNIVAQQYYNNSYAGIYDKLSDVPGYGTEWNSRCVPEGVIIRGYDSRC